MKDMAFRLLGKLTKPFLGKGLAENKLLRTLNTTAYKALKPPLPTYVDYEGGRMYTYGTQYPEIPIQVMAYGLWEPYETKVMKELIKEGMHVVDIGANIGYYTLLFSKWTGEKGRVTSFEVDENVYNTLQYNTWLNLCSVNTKVVKMAVNSLQNSLDKYFPPDIPIDFIKIDTDGDELEILKGMTRVLGDNPQLEMVVEYSPNNIDVLDFLLRRFEVSIMLASESRLIDVPVIFNPKMPLNLLCRRRA